MRKNRDIFLTGILVLLLLPLFAFRAQAQTAPDYTILDCYWDEYADGTVLARWDRADEKAATSYRVRLYQNGDGVGGFFGVNGCSVDLTGRIAEEGQGRYSFVVYPVKGGQALGKTSEVWQLENFDVREFRKKYEEKKTAYYLAEDGTILLCDIDLRSPRKAGEIRKVEGIRSEYVELESMEFSRPYETWLPGKMVDLTLHLRAKEGLLLNEYTYFTSNDGTMFGTPEFSGEDRATVRMHYYPNGVLEQPEHVYINDKDCLCWDPVDYADGYRVRVYCLRDQMKSAVVYGCSFPLAEYLAGGCTDVSVTALEDNDTYIHNSVPATLKNVDRYCPQGWQYQSGFWYYYIEGEKTDPGWFQDSDGNWYYFDRRSRMKTGYIKDEEGKRYFMNDGTRTDLPLGALVSEEKGEEK